MIGGDALVGVGGPSWPAASTRVVGVIGSNVATSLSPPIHNAAYRSLGLDWVYVAFPVTKGEAGGAVEAMRALGIAGLSVTIPHKVDVVAHLDHLTDTALAVGAVNTIYRDANGLVGENTDVAGLTEDVELAAGESFEGKRVVILGSGGAARAAAWAALSSGANSVEIVARRPEAARKLVDSLRAAAVTNKISGIPIEAAGGEDVHSAVSRAHFVISATPPLKQDDFLIDPDWMSDSAFLYDLAYYPPITSLVEAVHARGVRASAGLGMLVAQAACQVEIWTGRVAPRATMCDAAAAALAGDAAGA